jgi:type VI secretion system protein ImpF
MSQKQENIQASILDRLIDVEPEVSREPVQYRFLTLGQARASVARDLENILNTKRSILVPPASCKEVASSLFLYGLQDFTAQNPKSAMVRQHLRQQIERAVSRFEPRLRNVRVNFEISMQNERTLGFRITGLLVMDPVREPVTFDTYFDVIKGDYVVSK